MLIDHLKVQVKLNIFINYVNDNYIKYEEVGEDQLNYNYRQDIVSFRDLIAFHYHKGSVYDTPFWKNAKEISNKKLEGSEWMKICMNKQFSLEGAVQLDDAWTTSPIAHPMFIWEIDQAFKFGYFDHLPQHHLVT